MVLYSLSTRIVIAMTTCSMLSHWEYEYLVADLCFEMAHVGMMCIANAWNDCFPIGFPIVLLQWQHSGPQHLTLPSCLVLLVASMPPPYRKPWLLEEWTWLSFEQALALALRTGGTREWLVGQWQEWLIDRDVVSRVDDAGQTLLLLKTSPTGLHRLSYTVTLDDLPF